MAGDCPHNTFLETTLQQCHDGSALVTSNHESYLKIIGDLKNDLEQISCEVIMVQKECSGQHQDHDTEDVDFVNSLKELETQNDRLEQALKLQTQAKDAALTEQQLNNETLKCQIDNMHHMLFERNQKIKFLTDMLKNISQIPAAEPKQAALEYNATLNNFEKKIENLSVKLDQSRRQEHFLHRETRKLTEELNESRRKNKEYISQTHRLAGLLKCQETHRMELAAKYETLEQNYEDQAKKLRSVNNQLCLLDEKFQALEIKQNERNMECNLLREEVLSLKEKYACATGELKSMQDQNIKTERELYTAHEVINEQKIIMQRNESNYLEEHRRWQEINSQLKAKLADLLKDHKKLQEEHEKEKEINSQQIKLINNFRKWQDQQLKAEQSTRDGLHMYQNYIQDMLHEKEKLLANFHDLSKDYSLLQNELERLKLCPLSLPNNNSITNASEKSIPQILELVRRTARRVSEHNSSFKDEEPNASRDDSSSAYRPSEERL